MLVKLIVQNTDNKIPTNQLKPSIRSQLSNLLYAGFQSHPAYSTHLPGPTHMIPHWLPTEVYCQLSWKHCTQVLSPSVLALCNPSITTHNFYILQNSVYRTVVMLVGNSIGTNS